MEKHLKQLSDYVTIQKAAEMLGVSPSTLRNWDRKGKLIAYRHPINGYRLYEKDSLEDILRQVEVGITKDEK